jgi:hypothetical protein
MSLDKLIQTVKEYASWELAGVLIVAIRRFLRQGTPNPDESAKARVEGAMCLTPNGWEIDKSRRDSNSPVRPR